MAPPLQEGNAGWKGDKLCSDHPRFSPKKRSAGGPPAGSRQMKLRSGTSPWRADVSALPRIAKAGGLFTKVTGFFVGRSGKRAGAFRNDGDDFSCMLRLMRPALSIQGARQNPVVRGNGRVVTSGTVAARALRGNLAPLMSIIGIILIGLLAGAIAKLLTPGRDPGGWFITILLGIGGSLVANYLGRTLGWYRADDAAGFVASVVGAILILLLYRLLVRKGR